MRWRRRFRGAANGRAELKRLFAAYVEAKQKQNVLDYDDLLWLWAEAMNEPALAAEVGARFDHVLVDEYQDTNKLQARILLAMKPDGRGVTVVGDDAQSIYSFRAADVRNILEFPKAFAPAARMVTLEQNYRSTSPILEASNAVIDLAQERFTKNLRTDAQAAARAPKLVSVRDEAAQASLRRRVRAGSARAGRGAESASRAVPRGGFLRAPVELELAQPRHSVREVRRAEVSRSRAREGFSRDPALGAKRRRPHRRLSHVAARARRRPRESGAHSGCDG